MNMTSTCDTAAAAFETRSLCDDAYLTYPHSNGFLDAQTAVLGAFDGGVFRMLAVALGSSGQGERPRQLLQLPAEKPLWFDIAQAAQVAVIVRNGEVLLVDLAGGGMRVVYTAQGGWRPSDVASIDHAGQRILLSERSPDSNCSRLIQIDVTRGDVKTLVQHDWWINHVHFCPHDEAWIGYCHEGATEVPDRVWAWHAAHAPAGRCIFDQQAAAEDPSRPLYVGHERFGFSRTSSFVVAYGVSPGGPRGLYEIFPQPNGLRPRLVSGGEGDWHCDISRDGRLAVVDTAGPHQLPDGTYVDGRSGSDILLIDTTTARRHLLGRAQVLSHPYHPHPVFAPDGSAVLFNDAVMADGRIHSAVRIARVPNSFRQG